MGEPLSRAIAGAGSFADQCHYFALALHDLTGMPLAYVGNRGRDGELLVGHVAVRVAPGVVADADGAWEEHELLSMFGASEAADASRRDVVGSLGGRLSAYARGRVSEAGRLLASDPGYVEGLEALAAPAPSP